MPLMPVVFAVHNLSAAQQLDATIQYSVNPLGAPNGSVSGTMDVLADASTNETTYFIASGLSRGPSVPRRALSLDRNSVVFTTSEGAPKPNLTTLTNGDDCDKDSAFVFPPILGSRDIPSELGFDETTCAELVNSTYASMRKLTLTSCQVSISSDVEPDILARITDDECRNAIIPGVKCPPSDPKVDVAADHDHVQAAWLAATLAFALSFAVVTYQSDSGPTERSNRALKHSMWTNKSGHASPSSPD
ncbi:uncharacterized protein BDV14DRAFT_202810 [Aspergillus stella-maris]|uniref:uncharacterized protein n=1 Tax=Aspergillus stella-maris TaxID=1810926 RepID=UPI003CCD6F6F